MIEIGKLIQAANEMVPLPASAVRLAQLVNDPDTGIDEIAEVVAYDQALTVRFLRMANSAFSASAERITDVKDAVMRLGGSQVLAFAMSAHARGMLRRPLPTYAYSEDELWQHSVRAALAIEVLPKAVHQTAPPAAFAAALLHDIGKLIIDRFVTPEDLELIQRARSEGQLTPLQAEAEILEVNHAELGGIVAQHWNLPEPIVHGIIYHHEPERAMEAVPDFVYLANKAAKYEPPGDDEEAAVPELEAGVVERTGIDGAAVNQIGAIVVERFEEVFARFEAGA